MSDPVRDWQPRLVLGLCRRSREVPGIRAAVRFLAADPWFARAVCPGSDAVTVAEAFVFPLVVQALVAVRANLRWPPPPMGDDAIERLTGVPRLGRALDAAGVCPRDADGLYDLTPIDLLLPFDPPDKKHQLKNRQKERARRRKRLAALGLKPATKDRFEAVPKVRWIPPGDESCPSSASPTT